MRAWIRTPPFLITMVLCMSSSIADVDEPWATGVSAADQKTALVLDREGNALSARRQWKEASAKYAAALSRWDHPAVHFDAALCAIELDRPVDAYEHLAAALRYGEAPLGASRHKQALSYQKLVAARIAELELVCKEPGASVTLDGNPVLVGPGRATRHVLAKQNHQVVVTKPRYETMVRTIQPEAGKKAVLVLEIRAAPRH